MKAFIVPAESVQEGPDVAEELIEHCRKHLIKWSCPREIEFRSELPRTRVGKIDYVALTRSESQRVGAARQ